MRLTVATIVFSCLFQFLPAAPEDDLKLTHSSIMAAVREGNLTMLESMIDPRAMGFFQTSQFPVQLSGQSSGIREIVPSIVSDLSLFVSSPYEQTARVIGDTGIVCSTRVDETKDKRKAKTRYLRSSFVYSKVSGNWRLVSWHTSDTPLSK